MRRLCFTILLFGAVLLMVSPLFAQGSRDGTSSEGKSTFTNIAAVGINKNGDHAITKPGVPGYIELVSGAGNTYYLYISYDGKLLLASAQAVGYQASPATVDWGGELASGTVVGLQK